jgi:acyl-CoA synthetase (AMP-forming)/AMP-acid ligase II
MGRDSKALVVVEGDTSEEELIAFCREKLAHYKCPTTIEFRDELARTATGKLRSISYVPPIGMVTRNK